MTGRERRHVAVLEKRVAYIEQHIGEMKAHAENYSWRVCELKALRFALECIKEREERAVGEAGGWIRGCHQGAPRRER